LIVTFLFSKKIEFFLETWKDASLKINHDISKIILYILF